MKPSGFSRKSSRDRIVTRRTGLTGYPELKFRFTTVDSNHPVHIFLAEALPIVAAEAFGESDPLPKRRSKRFRVADVSTRDWSQNRHAAAEVDTRVGGGAC